jgi:hypothetical protein
VKRRDTHTIGAIVLGILAFFTGVGAINLWDKYRWTQDTFLGALYAYANKSAPTEYLIGCLVCVAITVGLVIAAVKVWKDRDKPPRQTPPPPPTSPWGPAQPKFWYDQEQGKWRES